MLSSLLISVVTITMLLGLQSCGPMPPNSRDIYVGLMKESQILYQGNDATGDATEVRARRVLSHSSRYDMLINPSSRDYVPLDVQTGALRVKREELSNAASLMFDAAKLYEKEGNNIKAKGVYQDVIRTFTGSAFGGYRDRAKMELENLKDAEKSANR